MGTIAAPAAGNLLVLLIANGGAATVSSVVVSGASSSWTITRLVSDGAVEGVLAYCPNCPSGLSTTVTISFSGAGAAMEANFWEISGAKLTSPLDTTAMSSGITAIASAPSGTITSGSFSTAKADEIILVMARINGGVATTPVGGSGNWTISSPLTLAPPGTTGFSNNALDGSVVWYSAAAGYYIASTKLSSKVITWSWSLSAGAGGSVTNAIKQWMIGAAFIAAVQRAHGAGLLIRSRIMIIEIVLGVTALNTAGLGFLFWRILCLTRDSAIPVPAHIPRPRLHP